MKLIAKQPCSFQGESFLIGEEIPMAMVRDPRGQEKMGVLAMVNDRSEAVPTQIPLRIHAQEGDVELSLSHEGLQAVFDAIGGTAEQARDVIETMTDGQALLLLHLSDGRKSIQAAAQARAKDLGGEEVGEG